MRSRRVWIIAAVSCLLGGVLWYFTAYPRGMLMAYLDHARGHYRLQTGGPPPPPWYGEYAGLLNDRYGIELNWVAGCSPSDAVVWYAQGYNSVSHRLLLERYGHDVFTECSEEARRHRQLEGP